MLQYLLNTTAIWLMSLLLFDLFLRKESYHNYNRFYLLFTFLLGALFPLIHLPRTDRYPLTLQKPIEEVIVVKQNVIAASTPAPSHLNWQQWLWVLYFAGALIAAMLLVVESLKLAGLYRSGIRSKQHTWTIIETGKDHAPFSFLNTLFVSARQQYSDEEWSMILIHEGRHTTLLHFADLLLMQLARIIFWFHPLVYIYNKRLLLIHEYQADKASSRQPQIYGQFLVEQALLQAAPSISHSFNRSPIKKRILMLTHRSSAAARTKMLVFIPLAAVCIICFSQNSFSQGPIKDGNKVTWRGNVFELSTPYVDTYFSVDPVTGKEDMKLVRHDAEVKTMNGKPLVWAADEDPKFTGSDKNLRVFLLKNLKDELAKLENGFYTLNISDILIDDHGRIVYFNYKEMQRSNPDYKPTKNTPAPIVINGGDPQITVSIDKNPNEKGPVDPVIMVGKDAQLPPGTSQAALNEQDKKEAAQFTKVINGDKAAGNAPKQYTITERRNADGEKKISVSGTKPYTMTLRRNTDPNAHLPINPQNQQEIYDKVCKLMETAPGFIPGTFEGKNVVSEYGDAIYFFNNFKIQDHKVYDITRSGTWEELK